MFGSQRGFPWSYGVDLTCRERRGGVAKGRPRCGWTPGGGDGDTQGTGPCSVLPPREETHAQAAPAFVGPGSTSEAFREASDSAESVTETQMLEGGGEGSRVSSGRPLPSPRLPLAVQRHRVDGTRSAWDHTPNKV